MKINEFKIAMTIIVLNKNHVQKDDREGFLVGATSFSFQIAQYLKSINRFCGYIFYERNDDINEPVVYYHFADDQHSAIVQFNFNMPASLIQEVLKQAIENLSCNFKTVDLPTIVYYQTDTLLSYHPTGIPCCVTHHGPFIEDFTAHYSLDEAYEAFGNESKVSHLFEQQEKGIQQLKSGGCFVIVHSSLQQQFLSKKAIPSSLFLRIIPPFNLENHSLSLKTKKALPPSLTSSKQDPITLVTAVARLDYFKNIELFISAATQLMHSKANVKAVIYGDQESITARREKLNRLIPDELKNRFSIHPKLSPDNLDALFSSIKGKGIFICTSRYETLGITPLEAALAGVFTLMPDLPMVEASQYFSLDAKYKYSTDELINKLSVIIEHKSYDSENQQQMIYHKFSPNNFQQSICNVWQKMTLYTLNHTASLTD